MYINVVGFRTFCMQTVSAKETFTYWVQLEALRNNYIVENPGIDSTTPSYSISASVSCLLLEATTGQTGDHPLLCIPHGSKACIRTHQEISGEFQLTTEDAERTSDIPL